MSCTSDALSTVATSPVASSSLPNNTNPYFSKAGSVELTTLLPADWQQRENGPMHTFGTLLSNPFFSAGAGLWLLTVCGAFSRQLSQSIVALLRRRFIVSMEMTNQDRSYDWMMRWLASQSHFRVQQVSVMTSHVRMHGNDVSRGSCLFGPCPNVRHWLVYDGRPIVLSRRRNENKLGGSGDVFEVLQLTTLGTSSAIMQKMMTAAQGFSNNEDSDKTVIYTNAGGRWVRQAESRARRPLESVVLPGNAAQELLKDVQRFLNSASYYRHLGVPYRRGYLLHGPPGCGKTSLIMALAGELRLSIGLVSLSNRSLNDESLMDLLNTAEMHSIVLIEDIDRAFRVDSNVTMSGVLNALDGVGAQEGRLVFMTTNHVERLDSALIRPGRADVKLEIGLLDHTQARQMFMKFFPSASSSQCDAFAMQITPHTVSAAQIQSHLFHYRDDVNEAVSQIGDFLREVTAFDAKIQNVRREQERVTMKVQALPRAPILDNNM